MAGTIYTYNLSSLSLFGMSSRLSILISRLILLWSFSGPVLAEDCQYWKTQSDRAKSQADENMETFHKLGGDDSNPSAGRLSYSYYQAAQAQYSSIKSYIQKYNACISPQATGANTSSIIGKSPTMNTSGAASAGINATVGFAAVLMNIRASNKIAENNSKINSEQFQEIQYNNDQLDLKMAGQELDQEKAYANSIADNSEARTNDLYSSDENAVQIYDDFVRELDFTSSDEATSSLLSNEAMLSGKWRQIIDSISSVTDRYSVDDNNFSYIPEPIGETLAYQETVDSIYEDYDFNSDLSAPTSLRGLLTDNLLTPLRNHLNNACSIDEGNSGDARVDAAYTQFNRGISPCTLIAVTFPFAGKPKLQAAAVYGYGSNNVDNIINLLNTATEE